MSPNSHDSIHGGDIMTNVRVMKGSLGYLDSKWEEYCAEIKDDPILASCELTAERCRRADVLGNEEVYAEAVSEHMYAIIAALGAVGVGHQGYHSTPAFRVYVTPGGRQSWHPMDEVIAAMEMADCDVQKHMDLILSGDAEISGVEYRPCQDDAGKWMDYLHSYDWASLSGNMGGTHIGTPDAGGLAIAIMANKGKLRSHVSRPPYGKVRNDYQVDGLSALYAAAYRDDEKVTHHLRHLDDYLAQVMALPMFKEWAEAVPKAPPTKSTAQIWAEIDSWWDERYVPKRRHLK